jgi:pimeloyl-ACP methyl ester carboxylesterase
MGEVVPTPRGEFFVEQRGPGQGVPLMFVAGLGDDHSSWADPVDVLSQSFRCITFDNRGIGRSVVTPGPYSTRSMAEDAEVVAVALGLDAVDAIGSSMGGAICQEWALAHPERVRRLVLSNSWAEPDPWFSALIGHWIDLARRGAGQDVLYQLALFCFSPAYLREHPGTIQEFLAMDMPDLVGFRGAGQACQGHDAIGRVGAITQPTLVVGGDADILTRPELSRNLAAALPDASLVWLDAGHMIFWERPREWADAVGAFVGSPADMSSRRGR